MATAEESFRAWLGEQIRDVLSRKQPQPPFLVWCDPERVWRELLVDVAQTAPFEIWADDVHELLVRQRFQVTPRAPRVVWLPVAKEDATYFKVFELQAAEVRQLTLPEALTAYGVELSSERWAELRHILAAHAREWLDRAPSAWKELTPGNAKETLIDDQRLLEVLATPGLSFENLKAEGRFPVFVRRVVDDFGLPAPSENDPGGWRVRAIATLLCSEATARVPDNPPNEPDRTMSVGPVRERSLKLLGQWQKQIDLIDNFEALAPKADSLTALTYWAKNLKTIPPQCRHSRSKRPSSIVKWTDCQSCRPSTPWPLTWNPTFQVISPTPGNSGAIAPAKRSVGPTWSSWLPRRACCISRPVPVTGGPQPRMPWLGSLSRVGGSITPASASSGKTTSFQAD